MKIEYNEKEIAAMAEFHKGNRAEGLRLHFLHGDYPIYQNFVA